jgi:prolyl oligopeptidase
MKRDSLSIFLLLIFQLSYSQAIPYPPTHTVDSSDTYFGIKVNDPYRWLENDTSAETRRWVQEENKVTDDYMSKIPFRRKIKNEFTEIFNYPRMSAPVKYGDWFYFTKNSGLQSQFVMYRMKNPADTANAVLFLDPNTFSNNG